MTEFIIVKYLHFLGIFGVVGTLLIELFYVKSSMTRDQISRISKVDGIYGLSAIIVLFAGLTMWFWVGKPAELYSKNWIFHMKVTTFIIVGILSIFPTVFFLKQCKGSPNDQVTIPSKIINMIRLEVFLLFIIPLMAVLMANGIGGF